MEKATRNICPKKSTELFKLPPFPWGISTKTLFRAERRRKGEGSRKERGGEEREEEKGGEEVRRGVC